MHSVYRNNIIQRMGGEIGFDFLITTYSENIHDDVRLDRFFGNFDFNALKCLQKELLLVSFLEPYEETEPRKKRVMFRSDMMGIDRSIFPLLEENFVDALEDCFIAGLDFELCKAYFSELHVLFKECTVVSKYRDNLVERMGGESVFEFLVVSYCELLDEDKILHRYFKDVNLQRRTLLQKELVLMVLLQPNAEKDFEALRRRVIFKFSPLFALGLNAEHFEIMESHFVAAAYECLSQVDVIQGCLRLFANLMTFFQDNSLVGTNDEIEESETWCDGDEEVDIVFSSCNTGAKSIPSPMQRPQQFPQEKVTSYVTKRIAGALSSETCSRSISIRSVESRTQTPCNGSYVSRRIQEALAKTERSSSSISIHSRKHKKNEGTSYVSKRMQCVSSDRDHPSKHSESTMDTVSVTSENTKAGTAPAPSVLSKRSKGQPKMLFSWTKKGPFRRSKKTCNL